MKLKNYALYIAVSEGAGLLAGLLIRNGVEYYNAFVMKPDFAPPPVVFPVVWSVLYLLMGVGAARVSLTPESEDRMRALTVFGIQLAANFFWSIIFFVYRAYAFAFFWLIMLLVLALWMLLLFRRADRPAGYLQIPYVLWLCFAAVLNLAVWFLNR